MIITVTLNAAIDKTLAVPSFKIGRRHRAVQRMSLSGGKGVNIARALKALDQPVIATGLTGGPTGTRIVEQLTEESILSDFVRIREESRTNTAVIDPTTGGQTEINERGPEVSENEIELFVEKLTYLARGARVCIFAGSLPGGVSPKIYADLIQRLNKLGVITVLDTDGSQLELGVKAGPSLVTPNLMEAEALVGHEFIDNDELLHAPQDIIKLGAKEAIVTTPDGCFASLIEDEAQDNRLYRVSFEPIEAVAKVGSGDAFLAGFIAARYGKRSNEESLRFAAACGAESTQHLGAGVIDPHEVERLLSEIKVETVSSLVDVVAD